MRGFIPYPDSRLKTRATPVAAITDDIRALWDEMVQIMDAMPGYGLAASQIGVMQRLAVVDCSIERGQAVRMANPEIIAASDDLFEFEEASPNLPGLFARLKRPASVGVRFLGQNGQVQDREFSEIWATSVQHQIDHLNGRMYFDNLSPVKRRMLLKKAAKRGRG